MKKSKKEKIFSLLLIFIGMVCILFTSGCNFKISDRSSGTGYVHMGTGEGLAGISIPGLGGCLSPGQGCDSCLWVDSCKISVGKYYPTTYASNMNEVPAISGCGSYPIKSINVCGCNGVYYGSCTGCGTDKKNFYTGCMSGNSYDDKPVIGLVYGSVDEENILQKSKETVVGCAGISCGCFSSNGVFSDALDDMENIEGID